LSQLALHYLEFIGIIASVDYIINQDQHHHRQTFAEEYCVFLDKYGIEYKVETAEAVKGV